MSESARSIAAGARIVRHRLADRLYHWLMAAAMLVLLFTGFLPILGLRCPWVDTHWIARVILIALLLLQIFRALFVLRSADMWAGWPDFQESFSVTTREVFGGDRTNRRFGKYSVGQKLFHHAVTIVVVKA